MQLAAEHRASKGGIRALGVPFTFLRNGWYHRFGDGVGEGRRRVPDQPGELAALDQQEPGRDAPVDVREHGGGRLRQARGVIG